jgi:MFS family permease
MILWASGGAVAGLAGVGGPVLGGLLVDPLGWKSVFLVNVPVGVVGFVLAWRAVPDLPTQGHRSTWPACCSAPPRCSA